MRLFVNNNNNVSGFNIWVLIRFSMENILLSVRWSFVNYGFNYFFLFYDFFSIAIFTFVFFIYLFSGSTAISTLNSLLRVHSWTEHCHLNFHTATFTSRTSWICSIQSALTITWWTYSVSAYSYFWCFSRVYFFQCDFNGMLYWFSFFWSWLFLHSSTKHLWENVFTSTSSLFCSFFTILIIKISFFSIT